ncbi:MAG: ABC transporter permease [Nitrososphaerota archaeon]|nr:ABC transporter permease [Nitrososphaerota archaeon]MDG6968326.1 ABC transporter permease [Nitrososphaerota archaeon]MDG6983845.1 ABC transporter permease [Nitrososphaerota archaeon]MDG6987611.1 ABC transporter permease [Nitrososphaerota archaeon]
MNRGYVLRRGFYAFITFLIVLVLNFAIPRVMPGSPVQYFANPRILPSLEAKLLTERFGLDKPIWTQFLLYLVGVFHWPPDLGVSYTFYPAPVWTVIMTYLPWTLLLVGTATVATAVIGIVIGILIGSKQGSKTDTVVTSASLFLWTMPFFWLGTILLWLFSIYFHVFPAGGAASPFLSKMPLLDQIGNIAEHAFLPGLTLTLAAFAGYSLMMRNTLVEELTQDYVTVAVAKGLSHRAVLFKHAARNAMLPMITLIGLNLGYVVSGALLVEVVFSYPGVGYLTYQAVLAHDYPLLQGLFFVLSMAVIIANFFADIIYSLVDPRVK